MARPTPIVPGPGQESVWDYPRPPRVEPTDELVVVELGGAVVAETTGALRVMETSTPPAFYLPPEDVDMDRLVATTGRTVCEWKGQAAYFDVVVGDVRAPAAAWTYREPTEGFEAIADHIAFYPRRMDRCTVAGEVVQVMDGDFYGGWITSKVVGPFKGAPGTWAW